MSIGTPFSHCPNCWGSYENCRCSSDELQAYERNLVREKRRWDAELTKSLNEKHPLWEAWDKYKSKNDSKST